MAPNKAAKKVAKKAAKKVAGKHDPHRAAKDARRTFEHLGRVQAIASLTGAEAGPLSALISLSDQAFQVERYQQSADLLRAAEHLSFATLHKTAQENAAPELLRTIEEELAHLEDRLQEHSSHHPVTSVIQPHLQRFRREAKQALQRGSLRAALEFARGAEALAHVHDWHVQRLASPSPSALRRAQW